MFKGEFVCLLHSSFFTSVISTTVVGWPEPEEDRARVTGKNVLQRNQN